MARRIRGGLRSVRGAGLGKDVGHLDGEIPAQGDDAIGGAEAPAQEAQDVEVAEPFAVRDIALASREFFT